MLPRQKAHFSLPSPARASDRGGSPTVAGAGEAAGRRRTRLRREAVPLPGGWCLATTPTPASDISSCKSSATFAPLQNPSIDQMGALIKYSSYKTSIRNSPHSRLISLDEGKLLLNRRPRSSGCVGVFSCTVPVFFFTSVNVRRNAPQICR